MKAEVRIDILADVLNLLFGQNAAAQVSRTYTLLERVENEADMRGYKRGYNAAVDASPDPVAVDAFQQLIEKDDNVVAMCGTKAGPHITRLGDDELRIAQENLDAADFD